MLVHAAAPAANASLLGERQSWRQRPLQVAQSVVDGELSPPGLHRGGDGQPHDLLICSSAARGQANLLCSQKCHAAVSRCAKPLGKGFARSLLTVAAGELEKPRLAIACASMQKFT